MKSTKESIASDKVTNVIKPPIILSRRRMAIALINITMKLQYPFFDYCRAEEATIARII